MNAVTRLTLVTHAITDAVQAARFPADEPLNALGRRAADRAAGLPCATHPDLIRLAPELRATETAAALRLPGEIDPALADLHHGRWAGTSMDTVPAEDLTAWLTDPEFRGHGGESLTDLLDRVRAWLDRTVEEPGRIVAVTHPAIARACVLIALDSPARSFWRLDIPPLSVTTLHHRGTGWTVRGTAREL
ncbi:histidine phosphatase family protein [Nocardia aurantia]|uniref:Phosphoserine phosphatase 1 n=1 Tax=Nocardia aurantia TaxID=2585199 RepID=A0A7K0DQQ1_9NOCA|nr:histidine phosphatase family protein [Nocardia aurantia]MQY27857.1 Phosphoserine phosphatase 1 [Nocardia aurantia]